jgi:D-alanine transfer protein
MKKVIAFICSVIICFSGLAYYKYNLEREIQNKYYDKFSENVSDDKFKSAILQKTGAERGDNLMMFGSSEFEQSLGYSTHPFIFFKDKRAGFQINLNGKAGYKCLVHAADFGALGDSLKGKKVVFVLSPQWFTAGGIDEKTFEAKSSELQVQGFLFNNSIKDSEKEVLASKVLSISKKNPNKDFQSMRNLCTLYSKEDVISISKRYLLYPYYWMKYQLLSIKDDISADKMLDANEKTVKYITPQNQNINWENELKIATNVAEKASNNNTYGMENKTYTNSFGKNLEKSKNSAVKSSYKVSPEYDDFKLLLQVCKDEGIQPLILNIPVNGYWYDFTGFSKEDRKVYYEEINTIVKDYGFQVADFSEDEYDKYFLKDPSHLGWKGWTYVDEAIDKYYNENQK